VTDLEAFLFFRQRKMRNTISVIAATPPTLLTATTTLLEPTDVLEAGDADGDKLSEVS